MKLKFLLLLIFAPLSFCGSNFRVLGELLKYDSREFDPEDKGEFCAYYIDLSKFSGDSRLYFKTTITYGRFRSGSLDYQGYDYIERDNNNIYLNNYVNYDDYSSTGIYAGLLYNSYTYYFIVYKPNTRYLYVAPPRISYYNRILTRITVYSTNRFGISIWVWIGIGAFVLVVIILSIVIYRCKRAQRERELIEATSVDPIPLNPSPISIEPNQVTDNQNLSPNTQNPSSNIQNPPYAPSPSPYVPNPNVYTQGPSPYAPSPAPFVPNPSPYAQPPPGY